MQSDAGQGWMDGWMVWVAPMWCSVWGKEAGHFRRGRSVGLVMLIQPRSRDGRRADEFHAPFHFFTEEALRRDVEFRSLALSNMRSLFEHRAPRADGRPVLPAPHSLLMIRPQQKATSGNQCKIVHIWWYRQGGDVARCIGGQPMNGRAGTKRPTRSGLAGTYAKRLQ